MRPIHNFIWQTTTPRQITRDVLVESRVFLQVTADGWMRIKHDNVATADSADILNGCDQVGIAGDSSALDPFKNARAGISPGSAPHRQRLTGG